MTANRTKLFSALVAAAFPLLAVSIAVPAASQEAGIRPIAPIVIVSDGLGACINGVVVGLNPHGDGFLAVKSGPGLQYQRIDRLYNGEYIHLCGRDGGWVGVVYTRRGQDCNVLVPWHRTMPYTGPCRSGWVHERWIKNTAGGIDAD